MKGAVFNIQKFCTSDGPGIRTVVFLKGCPLRCAWCRNAESQRKVSELMYHSDKCVYCGRCAAVCEQGVHAVKGNVHTLERDKCISCGKCVEACLADALELKGKNMTVDEVIADVMKDKVFYDNSGGGMTLSGGEPTAQLDFTLALLKAAKDNGLHTAIETCGYTSAENIKAIAEYVDLFLYDVKHTDSVLHEKYTGVSNERILENLRLIDSMGKKSVIRAPIIPDVNDTDEHFAALAELANGLKNVEKIEIEPYHDLGNGKYEQLGESVYTHVFHVPKKAEVDVWLEKISSQTSVPVIVA